LERLYKKWRDRVAVYVVYIREAHPADGWQVRANEKEGVIVTQPRTFEQRLQVAKTFCTKLELSIPCLIDNLDDRVNQAYAAWPDRLYVVGTDGRVVYKSGPGPRGFKPEEADAALEQYFKNRSGKENGTGQTSSKS